MVMFRTSSESEDKVIKWGESNSLPDIFKMTRYFLDSIKDPKCMRVVESSTKLGCNLEKFAEHNGIKKGMSDEEFSKLVEERI